MRILHTADWHLGKKLETFSRLEEQREVLDEICEIADQQKVDVVLIAGDLFDNYNPSNEAVELFYKTLKRLSCNGKRIVMAIAGNHDSPERIEAPDPLARECGIFFTGFPDTILKSCKMDSGIEISGEEPGYAEIRIPGYSYPLRILLTPYANEYRLRTCFGKTDADEELRSLLQQRWQQLAEKYCDDQGVNVLMAHLFFAEQGGSLPEEPEDEKPILHVGGAQVVFPENIPAQIQYTALGHLHRYQRLGNEDRPLVYSSSPIAYSFSEADQEKYVVIIDAEPASPVKRTRIKIQNGKKLYRKRFETIEEAIAWLVENQNCLVELTIVTEQFLSGQQRKLLYQAHQGIVTIIPEIRNIENKSKHTSDNLDSTRNIESLFTDYFISKQGISPNDEILGLFREIIAEDKE